MKFLVADCEGMGLDVAQRAAAAGHQVQWLHESPRPMGKGFPGVKVVSDLKAAMSWVGKDGLVFLTGNAKWLDTLDRYRELGFRIFGPTKASAQLEIDRGKGMEVMKSLGMELPPYEVFDSMDAALVFAKKATEPYVFKPMGDCEDKAMTFVARTPAEMVGWLQRQIARGAKVGGKVMMQEKVDLCCEIGISGWFGPNGFLAEKYQLCWEQKALMNDGKGPATGEMATTTCYVKADKLADEFLLPWAPVLATLGHRGDFAIGCMMDTKGRIWPLETTCRAGWPAQFIQTAAHKGDPIQWMSDLMDGGDTLKVDYRPAVGIVMAQPPFPKWNGAMEDVCGNPISGCEKVWKHVHPAMMMIAPGPYMDGDVIKTGPTCQTAGEQPLVVTGLGDTVSEARSNAYKSADQIKFPNAMYRTDGAAQLEKQLPLVHDAGYALDVEW